MSITVNDKNLGHATAYAYAKSQGFTGTEEEFAELMASYGSVAQAAAASATAAAGSAESAEEDADRADQAALDADTAKTAAQASAGAAAGSASAAAASAAAAAGSASTAESAKSTAQSSAGSASASATAAAGSASAANGSASAAANAQAAAETAQGKAEDAQEAAEAAQAAAEAAAQTLTVDSSFSPTSENPVQNKVISNKINKYDDLLNVIKITDAATTMGDISAQLASVNTAGEHVIFDVAGLNAGMYLATIYIGSGYYRIADLVTGFVGTGFFSSTDKLADIIKSGSQTSGKHYTVRWNQVTAQGERLNDAASITTDTANFGHFGSVNANYDNPFDSIYPWSERKLCNIDIDLYRGLTTGDSLTDCVVAWEGDVNFAYDHQYGVWVYTPAFFGRSNILGNDRYFDVTDENLQDNIAYKPSITGRWLGVDVTLTIDGESKHCNLPTVGMPMANVTLANQHAYAKNWGATLNDIYTLDATSLLYVVEYANMNLQAKLGNGVSDNYVQSSLHPAAAVSASATITLSGLTAAQRSSFIPNAIVDIGATDGAFDIARTYVVGAETEGTTTTVILADAVTCATTDFVSVHGLINVADEDIGSHSGYIGTNGKSNAYYRGETFYANIFQYILGAYRQTGTGHIWICPEGLTDNYDALNTSAHIDTGLALPTSNGYIQTLGSAAGLSMPPFCTAIDGSSSAPVGDYCYVPSLSTANTVLLLGGAANNGTYCGWCGGWNYTSGSSSWRCGSHPRLKTP